MHALQAKSFDAPIKLLFPRALEEGSKLTPFSMLGLGDIVIPGIFVALVLQYDVLHDAKYFRRYLLYLAFAKPVIAGSLLELVFST